jgi:hypothetical protein
MKMAMRRSSNGAKNVGRSDFMYREVVLMCGQLSERQCNDILLKVGVVRNAHFRNEPLCDISWPLIDLIRISEGVGDKLDSTVLVGVNDQRAIFRTMVLLSRTTVPMFDPSLGLTRTISRVHSPWAVRLGRCMEYLITDCGKLERLPSDDRIGENVQLLFPRIALEMNLVINNSRRCRKL